MCTLVYSAPRWPFEVPLPWSRARHRRGGPGRPRLRSLLTGACAWCGSALLCPVPLPRGSTGRLVTLRPLPAWPPGPPGETGQRAAASVRTSGGRGRPSAAGHWPVLQPLSPGPCVQQRRTWNEAVIIKINRCTNFKQQEKEKSDRLPEVRRLGGAAGGVAGRAAQGLTPAWSWARGGGREASPWPSPLSCGNFKGRC